MKRLTLCILLLAGMSLATPALAQQSPRSKFYEFPAFNIDGDRKMPSVFQHQPRGKVKFERLLKLKKSFLGSLAESADDVSFK
jgi:hypothetical protein